MGSSSLGFRVESGMALGTDHDAGGRVLAPHERLDVLGDVELSRWEHAVAGGASVLVGWLHTGAGEEFDVDHIDRNTFDNRRSNLRVCRHAENLRNSKRSAANTSGYKGVWRRQSLTKQWVAEIIVDGKKIWLGAHETPQLAHQARVAAATVLHGAYARAE